MDIEDIGVRYGIKGIVLGSDDEHYIVPLYKEEIDLDTVNLCTYSYRDLNRLSLKIRKEVLLPNIDTRNVNVLLKSATLSTLYSKEAWRILKRDKFTCRYCGSDENPVSPQKINLNDLRRKNNLISSCNLCTNARHELPYEEWMLSKYYSKVSKNLTEKQRTENLKYLLPD